MLYVNVSRRCVATRSAWAYRSGSAPATWSSQRRRASDCGDSSVVRTRTSASSGSWEPPSTAVQLEVDPQNLIMEGVRRLDERGRVAELLPELDVVGEALDNPERIKSSLSLTPEEWRILFLVDGRRTARDICRLAGEPDELATLSVLCRLLQATLVAVGPAAPPGPPPTSLAPALADGTQLAQVEKPGPVAVEFIRLRIISVTLFDLRAM